MKTSDIIYLYLGQVFRHIEKDQAVGISDIIGYVSTRPFNMKGQEFQELLSYPLEKSINGNEISSELGIRIESPSDKQKTDLSLVTNTETYKFSIKNYTITRFQVSTLAKHLKSYRARFSLSEKDREILLTPEQIEIIKADILKDITKDITIFALTNKQVAKNIIDIYLLSLKEQFLDTLTCIKAIYADRKETPHRRLGFFFEGIEGSLFSLDLGTNALNRGLWGEHWKSIMSDDVLRKKFFYNLLDVSKKDLTPFLSISQNAKNEAIMKMIEESLQSKLP